MDPRASEPHVASGSGLLGRLWREHIQRFWPLLALAALLMTVEGAATGVFAYLIQPLFDDLFASDDLSRVAWIAAAIAGVFLLRAAAGFFQRIIVVTIGLRVTTDLQARLVRHLLSLDLPFFTDNAPGSLIERVRGDTLALQNMATAAIMSLGRDSITFLSLITVMFLSDWRWTLLALIGVPLLVLPLIALQRFIRKTAQASREAAGRLSEQLDEMFHGIQTIKLNRLEHHEAQVYDAELNGFLKEAVRAQRGLATNPALIDIIAAAGFVAVLYYGGGQIISGEKTIGQFMSFFTALALLFDPLRRLSNVFGQLQISMASIERLYNVLQLTPRIVSPAAPKPFVNGDIAFRDVSLGFDPDTPVLTDLTFTAERGKTTAIVGPSGAGKTTVFSVLTRLIDPQSGSVTIGGVDVREMELGTLRDTIAVLGQEPALFNSTIAENIRLGRLDATDEEVRRAAEAAHVLSFARDLPHGLKTLVGPSGSSLSGGQRQRVAIARAIVKDAPILLLDELTSALDATSEHLVQAALADLTKDRTTLMIAHKLSTVRDADTVLVMEDGQIVERGRHDDLLRSSGLYARLHALQMREPQ